MSGPARPPGPSGPAKPASPAEQVETTLFRSLAILRAVVTVYAVALNVGRFEEFARPWLVVVDLVVLVAWSGFAAWAYDAPRRRRLPLYLADLGVAVLLMLSTPLAQSQAMLERHASTIPTFWVIAPVLAWAVGRRWWEAVAAAVVVSVSDLAVRETYTGSTWGNIFRGVVAAGVVGYWGGMLGAAAVGRAPAERLQAAHAERARLARAVHDGVLQVLALMQRRGAEAGGELGDLARLAGEQEAALRHLVQADARTLDAHDAPRAAPHATDLVAALHALGSPAVTVTGPGHPLELGDHEARELVAAVSACLDNVSRHVGQEAHAWVLVEDLGGSVLVTVRDDGPGIPEGRLAEAQQEGRLGICASVCGRMADLGGRATVLTAPGQGTEWELTLPREEVR